MSDRARPCAVAGTADATLRSLQQWRVHCAGSRFPAGNGNRRNTAVMPSRVIVSSASNEAMAATMLRLHRQEDTADALEGYQETVAGIYAAHATLLARARLLRDPSSTHYVTRSVYECQKLGSFRGMTADKTRGSNPICKWRIFWVIY